MKKDPPYIQSQVDSSTGRVSTHHKKRQELHLGFPWPQDSIAWNRHPTFDSHPLRNSRRSIRRPKPFFTVNSVVFQLDGISGLYFVWRQKMVRKQQFFSTLVKGALGVCICECCEGRAMELCHQWGTGLLLILARFLFYSEHGSEVPAPYVEHVLQTATEDRCQTCRFDKSRIPRIAEWGQLSFLSRYPPL